MENICHFWENFNFLKKNTKNKNTKQLSFNFCENLFARKNKFK
jgi:hypothetical protein